MVRRGRLFRKYVIVLASLVGAALVVSGAVEVYFSYQENKASLAGLQREKAAAAAERIGAFVREIEGQLAWTAQPVLAAGGGAVEQRRLDFLRLLRQVPAITELTHLDAQGREQLRESRLDITRIGSGADLSADPRFREARANKIWHGPVYFRKESEPYMAIAIAQSGGGVTVADVNLKFIWDVVSRIRIGKAGRAFVVDRTGALVAHPDISLVLQKTNLASLPHVRSAMSGGDRDDTLISTDREGHQVLTASATIQPVGWSLLVEQPLREAFEPIRASVQRTAVLVLLGLGLSVGLSLVLARRMVRPIRTLQEGAAKIGAGELDHQLVVRTGDEVQALAEQFNRMTAQLRESYATLEQRVEERTRELSEALERQTATSEVLRAISANQKDAGPVFQVVVSNAARLCEADFAGVMLVDGDHLVLPQIVGAPPVIAGQIEAMSAVGPIAITDDLSVGRAVLHRRVEHVHDVLAEPSHAVRTAAQRALGYRTFLAVPLLRDDAALGVLVLWRREQRPFSDRHIDVVRSFADQAVIAIENVRLFNELEARNAALRETLERQTATAEVLRVISSSPTQLQPVFDSILHAATRLCEANLGALFLYDGEMLAPAATRADTERLPEFFTRPFRPTAASGVGRAIETRAPVHIPDVTDDDAYRAGDPLRMATVDMLRGRTFLWVPLVKQEAILGVLTVYRHEVRPFADEQIALLQTFADQAVIAIENARLFGELEQRNAQLSESLAQQTATSEILRVMSESPTDVAPVLAAVAESAARLCSADNAIIWERDGESLRRAVSFGEPTGRPEVAAVLPLTRSMITGRAVLDRTPVHVHDIEAASDAEFGDAKRFAGRYSGYRTALAMPLLREGEAVGAIFIRRFEVRPFTDAQVELLKTFADQAAIAIENVRLFRELQDKTAQLQIANQHKDEFLANMSHELRTPLNAVIGFSEVLLERMFGDVNPKQEEYLRDIESSGRHLLSLINDILDLSKIEAGRMELELSDFDLPQSIDNALTLVRERATRRGLSLGVHVDRRLGQIRADERKIKQVLLNLLSNAVKFTPEGGRVDVRAALVDGDAEISVSDTGVGIAPTDQEAVFEAFRQVGTDYARKHEGTGLGLTLARKFVDLHGGRIWLKSAVGEGSTFTFTIPVRHAG